jgi:hypothetical protein
VVAVLVFAFGSRLFGGGPEFTVIVHYQAQLDSGGTSGPDGPGNITLTGNITNIGTKGGTPVVTITVWTGYASETFIVEAAPCAAGDHVQLTWHHHFDLMDPQAIEIDCTVEALDT